MKFSNSTNYKSIREFLIFRSYISHILVPCIFYLLVLISIMSALKIMLTGGFWLGLIILVILPCLARVLCEALLQLFFISDHLRKLSKFENL